MTLTRATEVLIVGGGYVGLYTALRIEKLLRPELAEGRVRVTVVEPQSSMTYQPFLPEAAAGSLEPRHVVVPLRKVLRSCRILTARVTSVDPEARTAQVTPLEGEPFAVPYDVLVVAPGSVARTLPIPGLAETGIGLKSVAEAIYLRNRVLEKLDVAAETTDPELRRRLLTFLVIGGGYSGIEGLAELEDMARDAMRYYDGLVPADMRWVLVEASDRILPEVSQKMGRYTVRELERRGIEVRLGTRVDSLTDGVVRLSDGEVFACDTVIWTAGIKPNPLLGETGLPLDDKGRLRCGADLAVVGVPGVFSAGDCAAVPDLSRPAGTYCSPSAQHAVRQAKVLGTNVAAHLNGQPLRHYKHAYAGSVASLGLHKGVADVYGVKLRGYPAWLMHRTYHLSRVPTTNRKFRVAADWTLSLFFRREIVALGSLSDPRAQFVQASQPQQLAR